MKNKLIPLAILLFLSGIIRSFAQDSCKVLKPEISGVYQGQCKNGLADGKGIAQGIHKYEGRFRKGLPSGEGKYTWTNGDTYSGFWKNGMKNGEGTYTYKRKKADSVVNGIWENDVFIRKITPQPYKVYIARDLDKYYITRTNDGNKVTLKLNQMGMQNADITDFTFFADNGLYRQAGNTYIYSQVIFPVTIKINYTTRNKLKTADVNPVLEVIIIEPGEWEIDLTN